MFKFKALAVLWVLGFIVLAPIMFIFGGWPLLVAYVSCKISGVCPI